LTLRWEESDGPAVQLPEEAGFGMTLIERSVRYELNGEVRLEYLKTGLVCEIGIPLADLSG
jgi:two-component sensor histidine kinase